MAGITAAIIGGGASLIGAGIGALGASKAAKAQKQAAAQQAQAATDAANAQLQANRETIEAQTQLAREQMAQQKELYERGIGLQEPFRQGGLAAQNRLLTYLGLPGGDTKAPEFGSFAKPFTMADYTADPGYAFRMSEGMKAVERSAAARGGLLSGSTLMGIQRFGQNLASDEFGNAYNRFYNTRNQLMNPLQAFLGQGQTATNALGNLTSSQAQALGQSIGGLSSAIGSAGAQRMGTYGQLGQNLGQAYGNLGQATASGYAGMANAGMGLTQNLGGIANQYGQNQMLGNYMEQVRLAQMGAVPSGIPGNYFI